MLKLICLVRMIAKYLSFPFELSSKGVVNKIDPAGSSFTFTPVTATIRDAVATNIALIPLFSCAPVHRVESTYEHGTSSEIKLKGGTVRKTRGNTNMNKSYLFFEIFLVSDTRSR